LSTVYSELFTLQQLLWYSVIVEVLCDSFILVVFVKLMQDACRNIYQLIEMMMAVIFFLVCFMQSCVR